MASGRSQSPLGALARGLVAGLAGTAALTAYQTYRSVKQGASLKDSVAPEPPERWEDAPAPGQVGYRFARGLFERDLSPEHATKTTNLVHWAYGTAWGGAYGLVEGTAEMNPVLAGVGFGSVVFGSAYMMLPAMGLYEPPWEYDAKSLGVDWSYHAVYGIGTALTFWVLGKLGSTDSA
jgi:hypothetical protein